MKQKKKEKKKIALSVANNKILKHAYIDKTFPLYSNPIILKRTRTRSRRRFSLRLSRSNLNDVACFGDAPRDPFTDKIFKLCRPIV